jgi:hypothetical protein
MAGGKNMKKQRNTCWLALPYLLTTVLKTTRWTLNTIRKYIFCVRLTALTIHLGSLGSFAREKSPK